MTSVMFRSDRDPENLPSNDKKRSVIEVNSWHARLQSHAWSPPTDVFETEAIYVVRVEVAGMREQDFQITLQEGYLIIRGNRTDLPERRAYHQMEIRFGEFSTAVALPGPVDADQSEAVYEDGFLTVMLPKATTDNIKITRST